MAVLTTEQIDIYWQFIEQDTKLQPRRSCYVTTNVTGKASSQASSETLAEGAIDPFALFAGYDLELKVQERVEESELERPDAQREVEQEHKYQKIETYGVLEGILKYAKEHVLLVGKPGSGKTTALERLLAEGNLIEGRLPIALRLRDLNPKVSQPVLVRLQLELGNRGLPLGLEQVQDLLVQGQLLLLLDGINELPEPGLRRQVQDFRERYRATTPMIFTTRPLNVGVDLGIEKRLEMKPLSTEQMREFVQKYLGVAQGDVLLDQLGDRLRTFGETPLLLWMICGLFAKTGEIPANLGLAFRMFVQVYEEQKELAEERFWQSRFLRALAFAMMPQGGDPFGLRLQVSRREAEEVLAQVLEVSLFEASEKLTVLLSTHLLQVASGDELEFKHQLFQEYYAAEYLLDLLQRPNKKPGLTDAQLKQIYLNHLDWTESILMMVSLTKSNKSCERIIRLSMEVHMNLAIKLINAVKSEFLPQVVASVEQSIESIPCRFWFKGRVNYANGHTELIEILTSPENPYHHTAAMGLLEVDPNNLPQEARDILVSEGYVKILEFPDPSKTTTIGGILEAQKSRQEKMSYRDKLFDFQLGGNTFLADIIEQAWDICSYYSIITILVLILQAWKSTYSKEHLEEFELFRDGLNPESMNDFYKSAFEYIENKNRHQKNIFATLIRLIEIDFEKSIAFSVSSPLLFLAILSPPGKFLELANNDALLEITSHGFIESLLERSWENWRFIRDMFEIIETIQSRYRFYNYEISQLPLPADQPPAPQIVQYDQYDLRGAQIGNLANTVHGNQQTHTPQEPQYDPKP